MQLLRDESCSLLNIHEYNYVALYDPEVIAIRYFYILQL